MKTKYTVEKCSLTAKLMREGGGAGGNTQKGGQDNQSDQDNLEDEGPEDESLMDSQESDKEETKSKAQKGG